MSGLLMAIAGALHPMSSSPKPPVQIILTSGTSWTVPNDWNNTNNKVECIGGSGAGATSTSGGGGGYSAEINVVLAIGSAVPYVVGAAGIQGAYNGSDTSFGSPAVVLAKSGKSSVSGGNGSGGDASLGIGSIRYSGGAQHAGGGGGAAGPHGDGLSGNSAGGGNGDAGFGGLGGILGTSYGTNGGNGNEWGVAGSGGGGGGGTNGGGNGGLYGAGGGRRVNGTGGNGAPGVIVITYTPA